MGENSNSVIVSHGGSPPTKKRKRVTRACDLCRKKKIRCDGQLPCMHCSVYSFECTYDQPSSRRKLPGTVKTESRLKAATAVVESLLPGVDIFSPNFDINSLVDFIQRGKNDGISASTLLANARMTAYKFQRSSPDRVSDLMSPASIDEGPTEFKIILPPKGVAIQLIEAVWENACVLFRFYHRPSFIRDLDLLYETDPEDYTDKQYKILPLMYSVMAVGVLFSMDKAKQLGIKDAGEGYKYFVAARKLIDITDARELYAIQSIVMMVLFLQCSARLSTCYSYIGLALRAATRAGLHRKVTGQNFNPIEKETRKRLFWTIRKMDVYVNAVLGLPRGIDEADFDQDLPVDIDDENVTEDGYFDQQPGKLSSVGISNAHTMLMNILDHIMKRIYPVRQTNESMFSRVEEIENEIRAWHEKLPEALKPGSPVPPEYLKANRYLSLSYCYTQIMLYRPFIHYCSPNSTGDPRAIALSRKCVDVARRAVYLANDLVSKGKLNGAYWFSVYTLFFAVACLLQFVRENQHHRPELANEICIDAELGKNALNRLKDSSMTATRTYNMLSGLFKELNKRVQLRPAGEPYSQYPVSVIDFEKSAVVEEEEEEEEEQGEEDEDGVPVGQSYQQQQQQQRRQQPLQEQLPLAMDPNNSLGYGLFASGNGAEFAEEQALSNPPSGSSVGSIHQVQGYSQVPDPVFDGLDFNATTSAGSTPYTYVPGFMDQIDQQLFGRFLPPYMMNKNVNTNGGNYNNGAQSQPQHLPPPQPPQLNPPATTAITSAATTNNSSIVPPPAPQGQSQQQDLDAKAWDEFFSQQGELSGLNLFQM
ncbi:activator of stress genes 1 [Trichomonascus vanleenenianus]|uniref:activator of stress genes 1 n=1 Tax=Trichomonascus vanleenenianus TaxID=2268995 RepID=UPI003ECB676B